MAAVPLSECVTTGQAGPRMHDERLFERRTLVLGWYNEVPKRNLKWTVQGAEHKLQVLVSVFVTGQKEMRQQATQMPSRYRSGLELYRQHIDAGQSLAPGQHTIVSQCEERVGQRD